VFGKGRDKRKVVETQKGKAKLNATKKNRIKVNMHMLKF